MVNLQTMATLVISFVVFAIVLGIGGTIMSNIADTQCTAGGYYWNESTGGTCEKNSSASGAVAASTVSYNATAGGLDGVGTFGDWLPTIAVILAAALVIGIVTAYFYMRG